MTTHSLVPANLKKINQNTFETIIDEINANESIKLNLINGPIQNEVSIESEIELQFEARYNEKVGYISTLIQVREYHEDFFKTGGRNERTKSINDILNNINPDCVMLISISPYDDLIYMSYLLICKYLCKKMKSIIDMEYIRWSKDQADGAYKKLSYLELDQFIDKTLNIYINKTKDDFFIKYTNKEKIKVAPAHYIDIKESEKKRNKELNKKLAKTYIIVFGMLLAIILIWVFFVNILSK